MHLLFLKTDGNSASTSDEIVLPSEFLKKVGGAIPTLSEMGILKCQLLLLKTDAISASTFSTEMGVPRRFLNRFEGVVHMPKRVRGITCAFLS